MINAFGGAAPLRPARRAGIAVALLVACACAEAAGPMVPTELTLVTAPPVPVTSGVPFPRQPVLQLRDADGSSVGQAGVTVFATLLAGGGTLAGTTSVVTNAAGQAVFTNLAITGAGPQVLEFGATGVAAVADSVVLPAELDNAIAVTGLNGTAGSGAWYVVQIPDNVSLLTISAPGGTGSAALYVRLGALPSPAIADCPAVWPTTTDACHFTNPAAGSYYVLLTGLSAYTGVSLTAAWQTDAALAVAVEPADTARSGVPFSRQPVIQLHDGRGAVLRQGDVAVSAFVTSGTAVLGGTTTLLTDGEGRATYTDLALLGEGEHTLQFRAAGIAHAVSAMITLPSPLLSSTPEANLDGVAGSARWYVVSVPPGAARFSVTSSSGTGDVDLYLRFDALPSATAFDCSSRGPTTGQRCDITRPAAGSWYVLLHGAGAYAGVSLAVPTGTPCSLTTGGDGDGDRLPDCVETNTGVYRGPLDTGTDPGDPDTDGDNLPDGDEVLGTLAGLDLPGMGVNPLRRDLLVEYDWFDDDLECGAHSHRPTAAAVTRLIAGFANGPILNRDGSTGINIISDYGQGGLFTGGNQVPDPDGVIDGDLGGAEFQGWQRANFAANRVGYFHYALMPHRYDTNSSSSGQAEVPGRNLIVSLYCANSDNNVANTVMHELGHNLLLLHGGFEGVNWKPNYSSVMNYRYQFGGLANNCVPQAGAILSYSIGTRPPLDERALDEAQGVCGTPPGPGWDWNFDGDAQDFGLALDINTDNGGTGDGILMVLRDYDDWRNMSFRSVPPPGSALIMAPPQIVSCLHTELPWVR